MNKYKVVKWENITETAVDESSNWLCVFCKTSHPKDRMFYVAHAHEGETVKWQYVYEFCNDSCLNLWLLEQCINT